MENIKKMVEDVLEKLQKNPELLEKFQEDPVATLEKVLGVDLPDDQVEKLVDGIKASMDLDKLGGMLKGLGGLNALGGLFGEK
ncbi:MAG: hypothetical protein IJ955_04020 [Oscillospiraceae bacterium]|nr:hypothetical protein [Oscillospiraceae bacterium]